MPDFDVLKQLHENSLTLLWEAQALVRLSRYNLRALFGVELPFDPEFHFCTGQWMIRQGSVLVTDLRGSWDDPYISSRFIKRLPELGVVIFPRDKSNYLIYRLDREVLPETTP